MVAVKNANKAKKDGQAAMKRLFKKLAEGPGVKIEFDPTTPYYYADPAKPFHYIRVLGGKKVSGVFSKKNGRFLVSR